MGFISVWKAPVLLIWCFALMVTPTTSYCVTNVKILNSIEIKVTIGFEAVVHRKSCTNDYTFGTSFRQEQIRSVDAH